MPLSCSCWSDNPSSYMKSCTGTEVGGRSSRLFSISSLSSPFLSSPTAGEEEGEDVETGCDRVAFFPFACGRAPSSLLVRRVDDFGLDCGGNGASLAGSCLILFGVPTGLSEGGEGRACPYPCSSDCLINCATPSDAEKYRFESSPRPGEPIPLHCCLFGGGNERAGVESRGGLGWGRKLDHTRNNTQYLYPDFKFGSPPPSLFFDFSLKCE
mmetsp:Transcript_46565/g.120149  ORF Transcript_46565/g.120149 Transcript_46565/m.120149 type:complete len:212 (+) Transcript_46565:1137-1772(+)